MTEPTAGKAPTAAPTTSEPPAAVEVSPEQASSAASVAALLAVMARLRCPGDGCPWDLEQSFASIAPYTVEEAYEVADAIARDDMQGLRDELGDLLFQVVFHARMAEEAGYFGFAEVAGAIVEKMIRRHPHVFGTDRDPGLDAAGQTERWESIKAAERDAAAGGSGAVSALDGVAAGLPPALRAAKLQRRAARVGFDWSDAAGVIAKLREETAELELAAATGEAGAVEAEFGDLLFTCINLGRHLEVDPDTALRTATARFEQRFRHLEKAGGGSQALGDMSPEQLDELWRRAKAATVTRGAGA